MNYRVLKPHIVNTQGLQLACEVFLPEGSGMFPIVIILHGFTGYKEENNLIDIAERLVGEGIATIRFTTSGFGDSEGTLEHDYRFTTYRTDLEIVYQYVIKQPYVDRLRIGVVGHSMGGKLAILFCADHAEIVAACAISAPVHLLSTSFGATQDEWQRLGYYEKISSRDEKRIRIPYAYIEDAENARHDVLGAARTITKLHALIIAGKNDKTVMWEDTNKIYNALQCSKKFLLLDTMDHWYKKDPKLLPVVHKPVVQFFKKYLYAFT